MFPDVLRVVFPLRVSDKWTSRDALYCMHEHRIFLESALQAAGRPIFGASRSRFHRILSCRFGGFPRLRRSSS